MKIGEKYTYNNIVVICLDNCPGSSLFLGQIVSIPNNLNLEEYESISYLSKDSYVSVIRYILQALKKINNLEYEYYLNSYNQDFYIAEIAEWDGTVSLTGIKRFIYSLFNGGMNESGDNIQEAILGSKAQDEYIKLLEWCKSVEEPRLLFL